jgi:hypothetical protein
MATQDKAFSALDRVLALSTDNNSYVSEAHQLKLELLALIALSLTEIAHELNEIRWKEAGTLL